MKMRYTYLSDGTKVSALDAAGNGLIYRGNFVYEKNGQDVSLESIAWDEGSIRNKLFQALLHDDEPIDVTDTLEVLDSLPGLPWHPKEPFFPGLLSGEGHCVEADTTELVLGPAIDRAPLYQDQWFVKDHLGNVRTVVDLTRSATMPSDSVILEQNDYLPYGTKSSASSLSTDSAFRYRYAGKEEQRFGAFDSQLLDFGARYYDPWSCQWTAVDPMGEKYYGMTPYGYCICSPISFVDSNGQEVNWGMIFRGTALVSGGAISILGAGMITGSTGGIASIALAGLVTNATLSISAGLGYMVVGFGGMDDKSEVVESIPKGIAEMGGMVADIIIENESNVLQDYGAIFDDLFNYGSTVSLDKGISQSTFISFLLQSLSQPNDEDVIQEETVTDNGQTLDNKGDSQTDSKYTLTFDWKSYGN